MKTQQEIEELAKAEYTTSDRNGQDEYTKNQMREYCQEAYIKGFNASQEMDKWIEIVSVDDLPYNEGTYFVHSKTDYYPFYRIDVFCGRLSNAINHITNKPIFTHYQSIFKPTPPQIKSEE